MQKPKVFLTSDHAGFELKNKLVAFLLEEGYEAIDSGPDTLDPHDDYPDTITPAVKDMSASQSPAVAIVIGGSGQGEAMVANRSAGVRAAVYYGGPTEILTLSREHNDANVLSLGARFMDEVTAKKAVSLWLSTPFSGEDRHRRRIGKLN